MKKPKKKPTKKHQLGLTPVKVLWCKDCGYVLLPELEIEMGSHSDRTHHVSPYTPK